MVIIEYFKIETFLKNEKFCVVVKNSNGRPIAGGASKDGLTKKDAIISAVGNCLDVLATRLMDGYDINIKLER